MTCFRVKTFEQNIPRMLNCNIAEDSIKLKCIDSEEYYTENFKNVRDGGGLSLLFRLLFEVNITIFYKNALKTPILSRLRFKMFIPGIFICNIAKDSIYLICTDCEKS